MRSGLSSWKRATASTPLPASPTTSWPPLVSASLTILRMNAASSTTSTRAIGFASSLLWSRVRGGDAIRSSAAVRAPCASRPPSAASPTRVDPTAQSPPSVTTRRPVAKRMPLTKRSIGLVGLAVELDDRAGGQCRRAGRRHPRCGRARPRRAPGSPRSDGVEADGRGARRPGPRSPRYSAPSSSSALRHAHDERVRDELDEPARLAADGERAATSRAACVVVGRRAPSSSDVTGPASRAARSRPRCRARRWSRSRPRPSSGSSPRRRRTARARRARRRLVLGGSIAHHRGGEACARPSSVMTNTLPPVTPST